MIVVNEKLMLFVFLSCYVLLTSPAFLVTYKATVREDIINFLMTSIPIKYPR